MIVQVIVALIHSAEFIVLTRKQKMEGMSYGDSVAARKENKLLHLLGVLVPAMREPFQPDLVEPGWKADEPVLRINYGRMMQNA